MVHASGDEHNPYGQHKAAAFTIYLAAVPTVTRKPYGPRQVGNRSAEDEPATVSECKVTGNDYTVESTECYDASKPLIESSINPMVAEEVIPPSMFNFFR